MGDLFELDGGYGNLAVVLRDMHDGHMGVINSILARLVKLEDANRTRVSLIRVEPNLTKYQFTQEDIDAAVNAAIMAERYRACRIVREGAKAYSLHPIDCLCNEICHSIRTSAK